MHKPHLPVAIAVERADELDCRPGEQHELRRQVSEEHAVVVLADAVADPGAVVVEPPHALAAVVAVLGPQRLPQVAVRAQPPGVGRGVPEGTSHCNHPYSRATGSHRGVR